MSTPTGRGRRKSIWIVGIIAVLLAIIVALGFLLPTREPTPGGPSDGGSSGATASMGPSDGGGSADPSSPSASAPPRNIAVGPDASKPAATPSQIPPASEGVSPELEPVAPESAVAAPGGVVVSLARLEAVDGQAVAPGEISGPAVRATVSIRNTGKSALDLEYVVVNAYTGADRTPAGAIMQPGGKPFGGSLAAGNSAEGVYLFSIEEADREDVTITVDYGVGEPVVVFQGDLR